LLFSKQKLSKTVAVNNLMPEEQWTISKLTKITADFFSQKNIENPKLDAELLLAHVLGLKRIDLYMKYDLPLSQSEISAYRKVVKRRSLREPLQYIVGLQEFYSAPFFVTPDVLIPRPETEVLVERVIMRAKEMPSPPGILDLCTGSGVIAVTLERELPKSKISASDISSKAIDIAVKNARTISGNSKISFFEGDIFKALPDNIPPFNIIVSNPPYVSSEEYKQLQPEISQYEPKIALYGGDSGMDIIMNIIMNAHNYIVSGGVLMLEMAPAQIDPAGSLLKNSNFWKDICYFKDYSGKPRFLEAFRI